MQGRERSWKLKPQQKLKQQKPTLELLTFFDFDQLVQEPDENTLGFTSILMPYSLHYKPPHEVNIF